MYPELIKLHESEPIGVGFEPGTYGETSINAINNAARFISPQRKKNT